MRVELSPALILHRRPWRDTSLIVEAFSREHGRIGAVAKGARRVKSRWRGLLEPLSAVALSWSGRGELYTLTGVEYVRGHSLSGNALMGGLYAAELVLRLTARDDPHARIHDSLAALLAALAEGAPAIVGLRFFERDLLDELGYGLNLAETDAGEAVAADAEYAWHAEHGLRRGAPCAGEIAVAGRTLAGLNAGRLPDRESIRQARDLMQAALAPHIGPKPLKSVATLQAMQQFAGGARRGESDAGDSS
ncbi:DNA repair protein RecO [Salinisphaera sp.]|uniref:DNA repair protein RecO n=1 Tax=Salinisphaera sp. TaxID=1914330 RepID=UPI002D781F72|nr:DNA repair protein RecO [Salinisphaera sp.]HET7314858.1 DNA repair protein RecO [Salinisphaera sp.]